MSSEWISASFSVSTSSSSSSSVPSSFASQTYPTPSDSGVKPDKQDRYSSSTSAERNYENTLQSPVKCTGQMATFISLVLALEQKLYDDGPFFFGLDSESLPLKYHSRTQIASGASFDVEHVEVDHSDVDNNGGSPDSQNRKPLWYDPLLPPAKSLTEVHRRTTRPRMPWKWWGKYVALKLVRRNNDDDKDSASSHGQWSQLRSEIRTLLHSPIRYHPNIVRFLGLTWSPSLGTSSSKAQFPAFILEFSELGTLAQFQLNRARDDPLMLDVKRMFGHDVAKGLAILHACGVVHGDLKHENVLVFPHHGRRTREDIKFIAKVADFGGSVMDLNDSESRSLDKDEGKQSGGDENDDRRYRLHMGTPPYDAPEARERRLSAEMVKKTDVYSLGLLVWRIMVDGRNPFDFLNSLDLGMDRIMKSEAEGGAVQGLMTNAQIYALKDSGEVLTRAKESMQRYFGEGIVKDQLDLIDHIFDHTIQVDPKHRDLVQAIAALEVQSITDIQPLLEEVQEANARREEMARNAAPGVHGADNESFGLFFAKFDRRGGAYDYQEEGPGARPKLPPPNSDSFMFNAPKLKKVLSWNNQIALFQDLVHIASKPAESTNSLPNGVFSHLPISAAAFYLFQCYVYELGVDFNADQACHWLRQAALSPEDLPDSGYLAQAWCARVHLELKVPLDFESPIVAKWLKYSIIRGHRGCIQDLDIIIGKFSDPQKKQAFQDGRNVGVNLLRTWSAGLGEPWMAPWNMKIKYTLDDLVKCGGLIKPYLEAAGEDVANLAYVYVNQWGHGLLHLAASTGNLNAVKALVEALGHDVNVRSKDNDDTPLLCACRAGHLSCALYLLDRGAEPDGSPYSTDTPLYWLSSFTPEEMPHIAGRLVQAGALLKNDGKHRSVRRPQRFQKCSADYENFFLLPVSPLSRAVMMESLPAIRVLLDLGADPLEAYESRSSICPIVVASVLGYPEILEVPLNHLDSTGTGQMTPIMSEAEMLYLALDCSATMSDPTSLESRITPLMVALGRKEIVEMLLDLGYSVQGVPEACPLVEAIKLNNEPIYRLLITHGADPKTTVISEGKSWDLLQILAENKTSTGRSGLYIAEHLINAGVPVDHRQDGQRSAFVSAVINHDFELADCLLRHGANVDFQFASSKTTYKTSVLGYLVYHPTERNLESLNHLLLVSDHKLSQVPPSSMISAEIADRTVFHHAAQVFTRTNGETNSGFDGPCTPCASRIRFFSQSSCSKLS
ncbi:hypothetical protein K435DRAFT_753192 [Dendrothele bispora CBS 962.96]|uniref:Protein kinase domain-containing protein n=1 Tax=Dendrothele bispora (strain CBS 962.96) TaxID=1314807 RepID=A0A4S8M8N5_DENBC|nr:hypothetical protein K435DRAFT_753192 [Dendrothele bispora CBS 962.96]